MKQKKGARSSVLVKVENILAKVRPYIQLHKGDVELVKIEDYIITLRISGACVNCRMADVTYNNIIAGLLQEEVPDIKGIILEK